MTSGSPAAAGTNGRPDQGLALEVENVHEAELLRAHKTVTEHLFHYTSADSAISGILASGTLRQSPFESTNDLWESRPLHPVLSYHHDDADSLGSSESTFDVWNEIDRNIRVHTKVACLTLDVALPDHVAHRDVLRGWAHLSLWAHYGAGHTGVCLRFDRNKLIQSFLNRAEPGALSFHGPVRYLSSQGAPGTRGIDMGQIKEFGVDAVAMAYAETNHESLFFRKHRDWSNEAEYRLILLNQSMLPGYIDIRDALTGVVLGDAFPQSRLPALREVLKAYPDVEVQRLHYMNRILMLIPLNGATPEQSAAQEGPWAGPRRSGSLDERLDALRRAETEARELRIQAELLCSDQLTAMERSMAVLAADLSSWPNTHVAVYPRSQAVPEQQRSRQPGVAGERVHLERGIICVVENLPTYSYTLVAAAAVQVLDGRQLRLHAVITTERWDPQGNERHEQWRDTRKVPASHADTALAQLLTNLRKAVNSTRAAFDEGRAHTPAQNN